MKFSISRGIALVALLANPLFSNDSVRQYLGGDRKTFSTKNHPKAKGVHFRLAYPGSWTAKEGERPNIVQKFVSEEGKGLELALIITKELQLPSGTVISESDLKAFFTPSEMKSMVPEGALFIGAKRTKLEGITAGILEYSMRQERAGMVLDMQVISYIFIQNSTLVQFQCFVSGPASNQIDISRRMHKFKPLFTLMANSIVFPDIWNAVP